MIKQKKKFLLIIVIISIIVLFIAIKLFDIFFQKKFGLGTPIIYENSRIFGYKIKPGQNIKRLGNNIIINNLGMRSTQNWTNNNNKKKIIFFGDSVTYGGSIVSNEDLFSEKTCDKLNKKDNNFLCGNLSVNGYSLFSIIRSIKYKNFNNENLIVVTIIANNFPRMFHNPISQPFWTKEIKNFLPAFTEIFFIYFDKFRNKTKYNLGNEKILKNIDIKYYNDLVDELKNVLLKTNKPYIILYSPSINEIEDNENNDFFKKLLRDNLTNFYDLTEIKFKIKKHLYADNIHLNKLGHEIYSRYIFELISENYLN